MGFRSFDNPGDTDSHHQRKQHQGGDKNQDESVPSTFAHRSSMAGWCGPRKRLPPTIRPATSASSTGKYFSVSGVRPLLITAKTYATEHKHEAVLRKGYALYAKPPTNVQLAGTQLTIATLHKQRLSGDASR
jgi:hypothetical protein